MPYSSMKDVPQALKTAGLNLSQANRWAAFYDAAKASGAAISPAAVAWTQFKKEYTKVGKQWFKRAKKLALDPVEKIIFTLEMLCEKLRENQ